MNFINYSYQSYVTYYYLGSIPVTNELHQVSKGSKSYLISGDDSRCSWVLVHVLGPVQKKELQAISLGEEVEYWGEPDGSSTFAVDVKLVSLGGTLGCEEYKHSA